MVLGLPDPNGICNINKALPGGIFPNSDAVIDNLISVTMHELVENILTPVRIGGGEAFYDDCFYEPGKSRNLYDLIFS
jgi:hypothetical protein